MNSTPDSQVKYNHDSLGFLREVGRELTADAEKGKLKAVVGREHEIQMMIETLCRSTKSNPVLVGAAGVGKTALVEGLAIKIVRGEVPQKLRDSRLFSVSVSALIAGCNWYGMIETRIKYLLEESRRDKVLVFIDELHTIVGTSPDTGDSTRDIAQQLKPALARGDIRLIGATTDDEYRRFIETDEALERRFQPIQVPELSADQTLGILKELTKGFSENNKIEVGDNILRLVLSYGERFLRNRHLPDKAIDLLEQTVGYAESKDKKRVTADDARQVVQRMIGMPVDLQASLQNLSENLFRKDLLDEVQNKQFCEFLRVSMQGLSLNPERPNAMVFLMGKSAKNADALAETISEDLFSAKDRIIKLNFAGLEERWELNQMLGIETGLRRQSTDAPIARISKMPWCVIVCEGLENAGLAIQEIWARAIENGYLNDTNNKKIYLSDAIIMASAANADVSTKSKMGFSLAATNAAGEGQLTDRLEKYFSKTLIKFADFIVFGDENNATDTRRRWLKENLHDNLSKRFQRQGIYIHWHKSLIESLSQKLEELGNEQDWERLINFQVLPVLLPYLEQGENSLSLMVTYRDDEIDVESVEVTKTEEEQIKLEESLKREICEKIEKWVCGLFYFERETDYSKISVFSNPFRVDIYFSVWRDKLLLSFLTQVADDFKSDGDLAAYVLEKNMILRFGKFAAESDGSLWLEYSMFAEDCDGNNFLTVFKNITETARKYKRDLKERETAVITSSWLSDEAAEWLESRRIKKRK